MERKFYKTVITVEVLSEGPYEFVSLRQVVDDITDGDCSGKIEDGESVELSREDFVAACEAQGSDPEFFSLDADGNDID